MKVTVLSPVTVEVSIAQATAWLERNGWEPDLVRRVMNASAWMCATGHALVPDRDDYDDGAEALAGQLETIAKAMSRSPAKILREMSEIVL